MENGLLFATILLVTAAVISWYSGMLLISACDYTKQDRYEDIANALYGRRFAIFTSVLLLAALMANAVSYSVYVRFGNIDMMSSVYSQICDMSPPQTYQI